MDQVDPVWLAQSKLRRRKYDECIDICTRILDENPLDKAVWFLKCRALTLRDWIDDADMEEEGIGDLILDDNATADAPRPGTSLKSAASGRGGGSGPDQSVRPMSSSGRPLTGFARPSTSNSSGGDGRSISIANAFKGSRPGTSRPVTTLGRQVRLGTASMVSQPGGAFIDANKLDIHKYASRVDLSKVLCDYLLYHDHNPRLALELSAKATVVAGYQDWWWKARLGKCYYRLGLLREAESQVGN
jgi:tetratricopeptide repeat protein 8